MLVDSSFNKKVTGTGDIPHDVYLSYNERETLNQHKCKLMQQHHIFILNWYILYKTLAGAFLVNL